MAAVLAEAVKAPRPRELSFGFKEEGKEPTMGARGSEDTLEGERERW